MDNGNDFVVEDISHLPLLRKLQAETIGHENGFIRVQPYNQVFPKTMEKYINRILNFEVNCDDTFVGSFPKCGTTWMQELVWCILNDLDFDASSATRLDDRVPYFEWTAISKAITSANILQDSMSKVSELPPPRIIKTHLMFDMLPKMLGKYLNQADTTEQKSPKFVYVARNPRDTCVSLFYHWKLLEAYQGTFDDFAELFLNGLSGFYTPFFPHILSYWNKRDNPNILFIKYENLKQDLSSVIREVANFLDKEMSNEGIAKLADHLSFDKFKKNPALNRAERVQLANDVHTAKVSDYKVPEHGFIRKGEVGDWINHFDDKLLAKFVEWERQAYEKTDLRFDL